MLSAYADNNLPIEIISCEQSFFHLISKRYPKNDLPMDSIHRLFSLMRKMGATFFVCENLELNNELKEEEQDAILSSSENLIEFKSKRLSFFTGEILKDRRDLKSLKNKNYLGYAIINNIKLKIGKRKYENRIYIYESVISTPKYCEESVNSFIHPGHYYIHNRKIFKSRIGAKRASKQFLVEGVYFAQQNILTSVCGHVALRMAINSSPNSNDLLPKLKNRKLTNRMINRILKRNFTKGKSVGCFPLNNNQSVSGIKFSELIKVIDKLGGKSKEVIFKSNTEIEYDNFCYPSMESNFPSILMIEGYDVENSKPISHSVPLLGHTINADRWVEATRGFGSYPLAPYISVSEWCDHLIINDDNYGMYTTLPSDMIRNIIVPSRNTRLHVSAYISILPSEIKIEGFTAEQFAAKHALVTIKGTKLTAKEESTKPIFWLNELKSYSKKRSIVCRTLLCKKEDYVKYLEFQAESLNLRIQTVIYKKLNKLPHRFWLTEITIPHIYTANRCKLGDVIVDPNRQRNDDSIIRMSWFPGFIRFGINENPVRWILTDKTPLFNTINNDYSNHPLGWYSRIQNMDLIK